MSKRIFTRTAIAGVVLASAAAAAPAMADFDFSGNMTLASDYHFRGFTQTDNGPAIQGGLDLEHGSGLYVGTWASNIGFTDKGVEVDVYGGYAIDLTDDFGLDLGALYYMYPGETDDNTLELYVGANWKWFSLYYSHATSKFFGIEDSKNSWYVDLGAEVPITSQLSAFGHVGYQKVKGVDEDFTDWSVGLEYAFNDTWAVTGHVVGVNDSDEDTRFVVAVHAAF